MNFQNHIKKKLSDYKANRFPTLKDGVWESNKMEYPHILPKADWRLNLLPSYRNLLDVYIKENGIKLHKDFHHLNSSQAMCLNFFFPLIMTRKLELILKFLGFKDETIEYNTACFEKEGLEVDYGESPTSFDFYFETTSGKKIFFEIKYTENDFGNAVSNEKRIDKFNKLYANHLVPLKCDYHSLDKFLANYQILRNLIHINDNSFVIFLFPAQNERIKNAAANIPESLLESKYRNHFFSVTWEELFDKIYHEPLSANVQEQLSDFRTKYL